MNFKILSSVLLCVAGLAMAKSPVETYGSLSVKNAKLVDSAGNPVTLRGMSLFWHYDLGGGEFWLPSVISYVQTNWHNTVIRAPIGVKNRDPLSNGTIIKGAIDDPIGADTKIRQVINGAINSGSYIIVDWHAHEEYTAAATAFFGKLAKEYGNTPNIIWEIFNEPTSGISENYITTVSTEIRKYSANVILIGNSPWAQNPDVTYGSVDKNIKNIAYTLHFYNDDAHVGFIDKIAAAEAKGHAVFASEWGMSPSSGDGRFVSVSEGNISKWMTALNSAGVSHCNWSLGNPLGNKGQGPGAETSAALMADVAPPTTLDPWTDASLTPSGKSIKAYLISKNPAWTLSDTTTKVTKALVISSTKKTDFVLGVDTVEIGAAFSKSVAWSLVFTGPSGAKKTYTGTGVNVVVEHPVVNRAQGTAAWKAGEVVTATLTPGGSKVTYTLSTVVAQNALRSTRVHETRIRWEGSRIFMPDGLISAAVPVRVMIRNAQGQVLWQKSASMGTYGWVDLGESAPRLSGVQFLEVHSEEAILRSSMAPSL